MNTLSLEKRRSIALQRKDYCDYIPEILKSKGLKPIHVPKYTNREKRAFKRK